MKLLLEIPRMFDDVLVYASDKAVEIEIDDEISNKRFTLNASELDVFISVLKEAQATIAQGSVKEDKNVLA